MDNEKLYKTLISAAKAKPEDTRVPYAFEKRVMANLPEKQPSIDWVVGMWRAAASCSVLASLVFLFITVYTPAPTTDEIITSNQLEDALQVDMPTVDNDDFDWIYDT